MSWRFAEPGAEERVAILVPEATPDRVRITAYNLDTKPVTAHDDRLGRRSGHVVDARERRRRADRCCSSARGAWMSTFPPRATTTIELRLVSKGVPYWSRPDLGISEGDVRVSGRTVRVRVHSLGVGGRAGVDGGRARCAPGARSRRASVPPLKAPIDLAPKTADVTLTLPAGARLEGASVVGGDVRSRSGDHAAQQRGPDRQIVEVGRSRPPDLIVLAIGLTTARSRRGRRRRTSRPRFRRPFGGRFRPGGSADDAATPRS